MQGEGKAAEPVMQSSSAGGGKAAQAEYAKLYAKQRREDRRAAGFYAGRQVECEVVAARQTIAPEVVPHLSDRDDR